MHTCDFIWKDGVEDFSLLYLLLATHIVVKIPKLSCKKQGIVLRKLHQRPI